MGWLNSSIALSMHSMLPRRTRPGTKPSWRVVPPQSSALHTLRLPPSSPRSSALSDDPPNFAYGAISAYSREVPLRKERMPPVCGASLACDMHRAMGPNTTFVALPGADAYNEHGSPFGAGVGSGVREATSPTRPCMPPPRGTKLAKSTVAFGCYGAHRRRGIWEHFLSNCPRHREHSLNMIHVFGRDRGWRCAFRRHSARHQDPNALANGRTATTDRRQTTDRRPTNAIDVARRWVSEPRISRGGRSFRSGPRSGARVAQTLLRKGGARGPELEETWCHELGTLTIGCLTNICVNIGACDRPSIHGRQTNDLRTDESPTSDRRLSDEREPRPTDDRRRRGR